MGLDDAESFLRLGLILPILVIKIAEYICYVTKQFMNIGTLQSTCSGNDVCEEMATQIILLQNFVTRHC